MAKTYIIFGGSKGLGDAFSQGLPKKGTRYISYLEVFQNQLTC